MSEFPEFEREMQQLRVGVADERGFKLYGSYSEQQAAFILRKDYTTVKRWRRKGQIVPSPQGDGVTYLGAVLADFIIGGPPAMERWRRMFRYQSGALWRDTKDGNTGSGTGS